jgi:hypothetical protein
MVAGGVAALIADGVLAAACTVDPDQWWHCHTCILHVHRPTADEMCVHMVALGDIPSRLVS